MRSMSDTTSPEQAFLDAIVACANAVERSAQPDTNASGPLCDHYATAALRLAEAYDAGFGANLPPAPE